MDGRLEALECRLVAWLVVVMSSNGKALMSGIFLG